MLDASRLEANSFRSVTQFHELATPVGAEVGIAFRLRSSAPLRFEYLTADTHELVAIDTNGNGDFNDAGDLHVRGPDGVTAAIPQPSPAGWVTGQPDLCAPPGRDTGA